jgi:hypothetical protein
MEGRLSYPSNTMLDAVQGSTTFRNCCNQEGDGCEQILVARLAFTVQTRLQHEKSTLRDYTSAYSFQRISYFSDVTIRKKNGVCTDTYKQVRLIVVYITSRYSRILPSFASLCISSRFVLKTLISSNSTSSYHFKTQLNLLFPLVCKGPQHRISLPRHISPSLRLHHPL